MTNRSDYFSRVSGRVDLGALSETFVVVVGVGSVGSILALELARCGVGHLALLDGDRFEVANLSRHALPDCYLGANKAEAMASHLALNVPGLDVAGGAHHLDDSFSDTEVDRCLAVADLVVVATDRRDAQRRIAGRALAMDIPAVVPGLYADRGGEVFVQLSPAQACFMCWDGFRDPASEVRSVSSVNADAFSVIQQSVYLCLAVLDPRSRHARDLAPPPTDPRPRQLFVQRPGAALLRAPVTRRPGCPGCAVGPSPLAGRDHAAMGADGLLGRLLDGHPRMRAAGWRLALNGVCEPPLIDSVEVSEPLVAQGATVTLTWAAVNATHVVIDTLGVHSPEGELEVPITSTTAFRVRAVNPFGEVARLSPVVRVVPLPRLREIALLSLPTYESPNGFGPISGVRTQAEPAREEDSNAGPARGDLRPDCGLPVLECTPPELPALPRILSSAAQLDLEADMPPSVHQGQGGERR
jgi:molybdopterin/thiamine biosynthesis adenylyltransferase